MKQPTQKRSRARYEKILAATSQLMSGRRLEDLTIREIAGAADVPVGTIYQFFGDKDGLFEALAERFKTEVAAFSDNELTVDRARTDLGAFIDRLVDGIEAIQTENEGFICLARTDSDAGRAGALADELRGKLRTHLDAVFAKAYPTVPPAKRKLFLEILNTTMISALARTPPKGAKQRAPYIDEIKSMLTAYSQRTLAARAG